MSQQTSDILDLIRACVVGDGQARRTFQDEYGEDIYNFPVKIYGLPLEKAGDFYVYAFGKDRIFKRIRTFAGRNNIQFRTFLSYYVLKDLFLEWRRTVKELETISLNTPVGNIPQGDTVLEDLLPDPMAADTDEAGTREEGPATAIWHSLSPEERLDLKLLALLECDLDPEDIRLLANRSGRSIYETLVLIAEVQKKLMSKDEKASRLRDELDSVWGWIRLRQTELREIDEKILLIVEQGEASDVEKLRIQKKTLEQTLAKRYRQRERIIEEIRKLKLTTPYKDIARLLNTGVGTVGSRISRLRERLLREFAGRSVLEERVL
jgi:RNA polymerase sigma factor (sigma-70 family)